MEHDSGYERLRVAIPQGCEMAGGIRRGSGVCLDLDRDQAPAGKLGEQVDLEPALLLAHVVEPWSHRRDGELRAELGDDEGRGGEVAEIQKRDNIDESHAMAKAAQEAPELFLDYDRQKRQLIYQQ